MKKILFIACIIGTSSLIYSQSTISEAKKPILYPLNIAQAVFGKFRTSLELPVKNNSLVFSGHYNINLDWDRGKGGGAGLQYRINFNKDPNIVFKQNDYWGFEISHDRLHSVYKGNGYHWEGDTRLTYIGLLLGWQWDLKKSIVLDTFISGGFAPYSYEDIDYVDPQYSYSWTGVYLWGNLGVQFGFKL